MTEHISESGSRDKPPAQKVSHQVAELLPASCAGGGLPPEGEVWRGPDRHTSARVSGAAPTIRIVSMVCTLDKI